MTVVAACRPIVVIRVEDAANRPEARTKVEGLVSWCAWGRQQRDLRLTGVPSHLTSSLCGIRLGG